MSEDFPRLGELPIKGGWGYSVDDAIIIDVNDPAVDRATPFNGVALEYVLVDKRLFEELIIFREKGDRYVNIEKRLVNQRLFTTEDKTYDHLVFDVTAIPEWAEQMPVEPQEKARVFFRSEFWFDITSFC
ncbi:hypothetical protein JI739_24145 [Ramlibacter sp. AW1]|uniref:Uncharacterized protein n=1 Tax=Ramlibacter aurantiacus TaxID=2801330 RepID=A0A936ZVN1_9BURK|nr:hypothetical protein [Ramlibacter aurantiacus]MBL0423446.1 hypothetical protein [Ramlibacter aurantiacus]